MTNIAAAIDIGTNSTKMTVARIDGGAPVVLFDRSEVTRLGKGVDESKKLADDAIARTLDAVARFAGEARAAGASTIVTAGTSALRDASNGAEVIRQAKERAGVDIQIVDGDREAELAYLAVAKDPAVASLGTGLKLLVFDIGGGSTELIIGGVDGIERHQSLNIGAVRLTERFIKSDPPSEGELAKVEGFARGTFEGFGRPEGRVVVAGIGGTAVNIAAVLAGSRDAEIHGVTVSRADVEKAYARFRGMPLAERRVIPGLEPERADVIVAGAAILDQLLSFLDAAEFRVSTRGLRFGLLVEYAQSGR